MRPSRAKLIGLAVLAVVTLAVVAFAFAARPTVARNVQVAYTPRALFPSTPDAKIPVAAFIGDSYTQGFGAAPGNPWTDVLASAEGWDVVNLGRGGTGYLAAVGADNAMNACNRTTCPNYLQMVPEAVKANPDIVVVAGGRNDGKTFTPELAANVKAVFAELHKDLPNAKIYAVSPILGADDSAASFPDLKAAVKSSVEAVGGRYLDIGPLFGGHPELIGPDNVHPNTAGHTYLGQAVAKALGS
ncbi:MAG: SGNH/GDSL hydrolase family protein [Marmoricola sp.]